MTEVSGIRKRLEEWMPNGSYPNQNADRDFIANAPTDIAYLLSELHASRAREAGVREALLALANAADEVGVMYFDTDTWSQEVAAMDAATRAARATLDSTLPALADDGRDKSLGVDDAENGMSR